MAIEITGNNYYSLDKLITEIQGCPGNQISVKTDIEDEQKRKDSMWPPGEIQEEYSSGDNIYDANTNVLLFEEYGQDKGLLGRKIGKWERLASYQYTTYYYNDHPRTVTYNIKHHIYTKIGWQVDDDPNDSSKKAEKRPLIYAQFTKQNMCDPEGAWTIYSMERVLRQFVYYNPTPYQDPETAPWVEKKVTKIHTFAITEEDWNDAKDDIKNPSNTDKLTLWYTHDDDPNEPYYRHTKIQVSKIVKSKNALRELSMYNYNFYLPGIMIIKRIYGREYFARTKSNNNNVYNEPALDHPSPLENPTALMTNPIYKWMFNKDLKDRPNWIYNPPAPEPPQFVFKNMTFSSVPSSYSPYVFPAPGASANYDLGVTLKARGAFRGSVLLSSYGVLNDPINFNIGPEPDAITDPPGHANWLANKEKRESDSMKYARLLVTWNAQRASDQKKHDDDVVLWGQAVDKYVDESIYYQFLLANYNLLLPVINRINVYNWFFNQSDKNVYVSWWESMDSPDFPAHPVSKGYLVWYEPNYSHRDPTFYNNPPYNLNKKTGEYGDVWFFRPDRMYERPPSIESIESYQKTVEQYEKSGTGKYLTSAMLSIPTIDMSDVFYYENHQKLFEGDDFLHPSGAYKKDTLEKVLSPYDYSKDPPEPLLNESGVPYEETEYRNLITEKLAFYKVPNPLYPQPPKMEGHYRFKRKFLGRFKWEQSPINWKTPYNSSRRWWGWWNDVHILHDQFKYNDVNTDLEFVKKEMIRWLPFDCTNGDLEWTFDSFGDNATRWTCRIVENFRSINSSSAGKYELDPVTGKYGFTGNSHGGSGNNFYWGGFTQQFFRRSASTGELSPIIGTNTRTGEIGEIKRKFEVTWNWGYIIPGDETWVADVDGKRIEFVFAYLGNSPSGPAPNGTLEPGYHWEWQWTDPGIPDDDQDPNDGTWVPVADPTKPDDPKPPGDAEDGYHWEWVYPPGEYQQVANS